MIINSWNKLTIVCGNHPGDDEELMSIHEGGQGRQPFYSCPRYVSVLKKEGIRSCNNRFSIDEMQRLIKKLEVLSTDPESPYSTDLTGYKWTEKGIDYEVLEYGNEGIKVSVLNRKAMSR